MALTVEWTQRVRRWRDELPRQCFEPLADVELEGFTTFDQLSPEQAAGRSFRPMPPGAAWGKSFEYGWFRASVTLPEEAADRRIALTLEPSLATLVWVNGRIAGSRDHHHQYITLARKAEAGARYDILAEAYGGHNSPPSALAHPGPVPVGRSVLPPPSDTQQTVGRSCVGIWHEAIFQLFMDVETLWQAREHLDPSSRRLAAIDEALREFSCIVDFESGRKAMLATVAEARRRLEPVMRATNGTDQATFFCTGHGHLDVAWMWPLAETERKAARTIGNQLALAEEYPELHFMWSQPHLYRMIERRYPQLYERLVEAVRAGNILADGAMWVEADTNITGGESLVRQFVHGKRFFHDTFGVDCRLLWLPDVFGYSAALPQIMRGCGVDRFFTTKIFWNRGEVFPYTTFTWQGHDGSRVRAQLCPVYQQPPDPKTIMPIWNDREQTEGIDTYFYPYGHGDGGGGPNREHQEFLRRMADLQGVPRMRQATPNEFFDDREARGWPKVRYVGELYVQLHRGTYTSQARLKRSNRKTELALREAEAWAALAAARGEFAWPAKRLDEAWKRILLNQFHDVLPGTSIERVNDEALVGYEATAADAREIAAAATAALAGDGDALVVFNSLTWRRTALVELPDGWSGATGAAGEPLPVQAGADGEPARVEVAVPGCGWTTLRQADAAGEAGAGELSVSEQHIENAHLRAELNERGELVSIFDKDAGRELAAGPCNRFRMYRDVPCQYDAWDLESMYHRTPVELAEPAELAVVAAGPLEAVLRIRRRLHDSTVEQWVRLRRGGRQIDFETTIEWDELHKLLKVEFPVDVHADEAIHEIQFGHVRRPNHFSRQFDADRFEVPAQKWTALMESGRGAAVLNDCKYGVNVVDGTIALTLLRAPAGPDTRADRGTHRMTYAFTAWNGPFADAPLVRQGYELNVPPTIVRGEPARAEASFVELDAESIVVEAIKAAEDGSGDLVLRLYESKRTATRARLRVEAPVAEAVATDLLERGGDPLEIDAEGRIALDFRPFEIKTVRLRMQG